MQWTCPACSRTFKVPAFPANCKCGFVQYENPPGPGDLMAIQFQKSGLTDGYKATRRAVGLSDDCKGCKKRQRRANKLRRKKARKDPYADVPTLTWSYGVTTVSTRIHNGLLKRTLDSLAETGFPSPRIFIDGECDIPQWLLAYPITQRLPCVRTPAHWTLSAWELYLREPFQQRYAMFQDDAVFVKKVRRYLEIVPYPEQGYLNLNTFPENEYLKLNRKAEHDFTGFYPSNQRGRMALALVFSNEAMQTLLSARRMVERNQNKKRRFQCIDGGIVDSLSKDNGWREYVHNPSLTWHTGEKSTMKHKRQPEARTFPGEDFDALLFLNQEVDHG